MKKHRIPLLILSSFLFVIFLALTSFADDTLEVRFLDVGQADACIITYGDHAMLIDGGYDAGALRTNLELAGVSHLDYIVATHDHEDHVAGLCGTGSFLNGTCHDGTADFIDSRTIVLTPEPDSKEREFAEFIEMARAHKCTVIKPPLGETYFLGEAEFRILSNARQIVLRLSLDDISFLFMADADSKLEQNILRTFGKDAVQSSLIKIGHHGSKTSTSEDFLNAVNPDYAVFTVNGTSELHPSNEVFNRIRDLNNHRKLSGKKDIIVYRTNEEGDFCMQTSGSKLEWAEAENKSKPLPSESPSESPAESSSTDSRNMEESSPALSGYEGESSSAVSSYEEESLPAADENQEESSPAISENEPESPPASSGAPVESSSKIQSDNLFFINESSGIFHDKGCSYIKNEDNFKRSEKKTKEELLAEGYQYCTRCAKNAAKNKK